MILLADAGSTKTTWAILSPGYISTKDADGINPIQMSKDDIHRRIAPIFDADFLKICPDEVHYYGAGVNTTSAPIMQDVLSHFFPSSIIQVYPDIMAVAHALSNNQQSLIFIVGTGSASCLWDGQKILSSAPSGGYLLGDEGSGSWLGKQLLISYMRNEWPKDLQQAFWDTYHLTMDDIIQQVYSELSPNRYLASFVPFIHTHRQHPDMQQSIMHSFQMLIRRHLRYYQHQNMTPLHNTAHFSGSVAYYFQNEMRKVCSQQISVGHFCKNPMNQLIQYYQQKWNGLKTQNM